MNKLFYPLSSLQEVYTLIFLSGNFDIDVEMTSLVTVFNSVLKTQYDLHVLKHAIKKFYDLMGANKNLFSIFTKNLFEKVNEKKITICEAPFFSCKVCKKELIYTSDSRCVVFTIIGPKKGLLRSKFCQFCCITYNADNYIINDKVISYDLTENIDIVVTSSETVIEISLLKDFDNHLVRNATTFSGNHLR